MDARELRLGREVDPVAGAGNQMIEAQGRLVGLGADLAARHRDVVERRVQMDAEAAEGDRALQRVERHRRDSPIASHEIPPADDVRQLVGELGKIGVAAIGGRRRCRGGTAGRPRDLSLIVDEGTPAEEMDL
jgi:hypothetical protein